MSDEKSDDGAEALATRVRDLELLVDVLASGTCVFGPSGNKVRRRVQLRAAKARLHKS